MKGRFTPRGAIAAGLALLTVGLYARTAGFEFVFDDTTYVTRNTHLTDGLSWEGIGWAFSTLDAGFYHPLVRLSHMVDFTLFGAWAGGHHLTNVALHGANTVLLFLALAWLTGSLWGSAAVAALFGVHPLHVESVAWVSERKDVLSTLFWFWGMVAYMRYARRRTVGSYLGVVVIFLLGLLSKPMLMTFPVVLLLLDYWPLGRWTSGVERRGRIVLEKMPMLILSLAAGVVTVIAQAEEKAVALLEGGPPSLHLANAVVSLVSYLTSVMFPRGLAVFYRLPQEMYPWWIIGGAATVLVLLTVAAVRSGEKRGYPIVGWAWYLVTIAPVIGVVQLGSQARADRYTYVPMVGVFLIAAWVGRSLAVSWRGWRRWLTVAVAAGITTACIAQSWVVIGFWRDEVTLFSRAVACTGRNWIPLTRLGQAYLRRGECAPAVKCLSEALVLRPRGVQILDSLGLAYLRSAQQDLAVQCFERSLALLPSSASTQNLLGIALANLGRLEEALARFDSALELDTTYAEAHFNRAVVLGRLGRWIEAGESYGRVMELNPNDAQAHDGLVDALAKSGDRGGAEREAVRWRSRDVTVTNVTGSTHAAGRLR